MPKKSVFAHLSFTLTYKRTMKLGAFLLVSHTDFTAVSVL